IKSELKTFSGDSIAIIVGSEGGFSEQEIYKCQENGAKSVTLGNRIMRCETASIVVSGVVMYELGEMDR
ncbi:MAG: RsmE family RNA methyltransferase, partial [Clostridia bacterium]|nr:RsmE family RNA methyltransferase [Clostridia bacterium]